MKENKNINIYYFTGTGNTLSISKYIAEKTKGKLIPIASLRDQETITPDSEIIGIIYPVFYGNLPLIVKEFVKKLENISKKYIFVISNYGGSSGKSVNTLKRIIKSKNASLSATYCLHMPQNSFYKPWENHNKIYEKCKKKLNIIVKNLINGKKGIFISNIIYNLLLSPLNLLFDSLLKNYLLKLTNSSSDTELDVLIRLAGKYFTVNEKCDACGICEKVCPVNNIKINDGKPEFQDNCENCLACYNWCPKKAIGGGIAKDFYYKHPEIKVTDIIKQKTN